MLAKNRLFIPLIGIALVLVAIAISPANRTPMRLAACLLGIVVLAIRAAFLYRKAKGAS